MMRICDVAKALGLTWTCVYYNCEQYLKGQLRMQKPSQKYKKLRPISEQLTSKELLKEWKHLTIRERPKLVEERFGVKVSANHLRLFYHENSVKSYAPGYVYQHSYPESKLDKARLVFV
jgi:transposase